MCGLPTVCTPYFPENAKQILLTGSSAYDPEILEKLDAFLRKDGNTAVVTTGLWDAVKDKEYENFTSIRLW